MNVNDPVIVSFMVVSIPEKMEPLSKKKKCLDYSDLAERIQMELESPKDSSRIGLPRSVVQVYVWNEPLMLFDLQKDQNGFFNPFLRASYELPWKAYRGKVANIHSGDVELNKREISEHSDDPVVGVVVSLKFKNVASLGDYLYTAQLCLFGDNLAAENFPGDFINSDSDKKLDLPESIREWLELNHAGSVYGSESYVMMLGTSKP